MNIVIPICFNFIPSCQRTLFIGATSAHEAEPSRETVPGWLVRLFGIVTSEFFFRGI